MLKLKLDKTTHATLPADIQKEYKADGDGFVLDTDVVWEDTTGLKSALEKERKERKDAKERVGVLEASVSELTTEKEKLEARSKPAGDLEKSWEAKLVKATNESKARETALTTQLRTMLVDNVAIQMAGEISTVPDLMVPILQKRLSVEEVDGKYITRVLDSEGKASALSVNELKTEVLANTKYAPILTASKASGGGAGGGSKGGGAGGTEKPFKDMNESERVHLFKTDRPKYDQLSADHKKAIGQT